MFTNTTPTDAYRGAGRPEATYVIERTMDALADELGMDRLELRRKNFITEFPATLASGLTIDSGDYHASLDKLLELLDLDAFRAEQAKRRDNGGDEAARRRLLDLQRDVRARAVAHPRGDPLRRRRLGAGDDPRTCPTGSVQVITGTSPHGQGHETAWAQIVADQLGCDIDEVEVLHGDTSISSIGMDTYGSRSLPVGGVALCYASDKIDRQGTAARRARAGGVGRRPRVRERHVHRQGLARQGDGRSSGARVHGAGRRTTSRTGWSRGSRRRPCYDPPNFSWPGGAHAAVVEVDTETGDARLIRYVAVDDVGTVVNPIIVDGQVHGGITQGIATALYEEGVYDEDGNLQTANLVTYLVPSAAELPSFELERTESRSPTNPLGVKGVGETGTIAAAPAVIGAVLDALSHLGVKDIQMPATPERVWRAIQEAKA